MPQKSHISNLALYIILLGLIPNVYVLVKNGPVDDGGLDTTPGYWGVKTATVNWCEADYVVTQYIAEFFNTISSLSIMLYGLYGYCRHSSFIQPTFIVAFITFIIVGFGSALFHGTLKRSLQNMDELPMVVSNTIFYYIITTIEDSISQPTRVGYICTLFVLTVAVLGVIIVYDEESDGQTIFLVTYSLGVVYVVLASRSLNLKYNANRVVNLLDTAVVSYSLGFVLWLSDRNFCVYVRWMNLHALWHCFAGFGTYCTLLFWVWVRNEKIARRQRLMGADGMLCYLEVEDGKGKESKIV